LIDLVLGYDHDVDGSTWSSAAHGVIEAKSVVADLDPGPLEVITTQTITLDGSASQISTLAVASALFMVDDEPIDGCDFPGPVTDPSDLICSFPASDLGAGTYVVSLQLTDSVGGITDTDSATLEIIEEPDFAVDFLWTAEEPYPDSAILDLILSDGWDYSDLQTAFWEYGDGTPPDTVDCPSDWTTCQHWSHNYDSDGYYDVTVSVTTVGGHWATMTHEVTIGDPPQLPTADFSASPAPTTVAMPINFTFTGTCADTCSYDWDFGDGSSSTLINPTHAFSAPDDHLVELTVTNDAGHDIASKTIIVSDCWSPGVGITQAGSCYGSLVDLIAPAADAVIWSTGSTNTTITIAEPRSYWADVRQGGSCWAYVKHTVSLEQCQGSPEGNVTMDAMGRVDAEDTLALIRELSDGDGQLVIDSWAGEIGAPGADLRGALGADPDGRITAKDLDRLLEVLFTDD
jgi:PKD repeat protein